MSGDPYISSEDSALLRRALKGRSGGACLEMGAGNGGNLVDLKERFDLAVGTDLAIPSMQDWKGRGVDYLLADRASCFRDGVFDLVAFNPPYLEGESGDRAVDGGVAMEVPLKFMESALRAVKPSGSVVFLLDARTDIEPYTRAGGEAGFRVSRVGSERLFFEELAAYAAGREE